MSDLARRTQSAVANQATQPTLAQLIDQMKPEISRALPKHMNPDRMARIATTVLRQTPALARCTPESFLGALMTASQLGLEPGPLGEAYLVPYGNTVTFIPGYRGLVKLAFQSGRMESIAAHVVYEADEFTYQLGLSQVLEHKPALTDDRGKPVAVYAVARFKDGGHAFEVMGISQVEAIRARSKAGRSGPWVTDWDAMARKTVVKQLAKWLPLSPEFADAAARDESVRVDVKSQLVDVTPVYPDPEPEAVEAATVDAEPAPEAAPVAEPDPNAATQPQLKKLVILMGKEGLSTPDQQHGWLTDQLGRTITTGKQLTKREASDLIDFLEQPQAAPAAGTN